jgi:hypothetical protein
LAGRGPKGLEWIAAYSSACSRPCPPCAPAAVARVQRRFGSAMYVGFVTRCMAAHLSLRDLPV